MWLLLRLAEGQPVAVAELDLEEPMRVLGDLGLVEGETHLTGAGMAVL